MDELRIPKRRVSVEFRLLARAENQTLTVFLGEYAAEHPGPERLSDLLNGSLEFLPALDTVRDQMLFLHRSSILTARLAGAEEPGDAASETTIPTEHELLLHLADGSQVQGLVSYVLPPDRSRVYDYLNAAPGFFRVLEKDSVVLVNKRHLVQVDTAG